MAALSFADDPGAVLDLTTPQLSSELAELERRMHLLEGLIDAHSHLEEVNNAVQCSSDGKAALLALRQEPFGYTQQQAQAVLEMPVSWQSRDEGRRLQAERDHLAARRASLRQHVTEVLSLHWFG